MKYFGNNLRKAITNYLQNRVTILSSFIKLKYETSAQNCTENNKHRRDAKTLLDTENFNQAV